MRVQIVNTQEIIPLKEINISGELVDFFGTINTKLIFENPTDNAIEVIYQFTLDTSSVITNFKATLKDKKLVGVVREKNMARQTYNTAVQNKQTSSILETDDQGRHKVSIGNIQKGDTVIIEYSYFVITVQENGKQKLVIPTNVGKKYDPNGYTNLTSYNGNTMKMNHSSEANYNFFVNINWKSNSELIVTSNFEESNISKLSDQSYNVTATTYPKNGDLVICAECQLNNNVYSEVSNFDNNMYTVLVTKIPDESEEMTAKEFIFFLDKSGSMRGDRIEQAKKALDIFLRSLPIGSKFNVILYDNFYRSMFINSVEYNEENLNMCIGELNNIIAGGGTEMYSCIDATLNNKLNNNHAIIKQNKLPLNNEIVKIPDHVFNAENTNVEHQTNNLEKICVLLTDGDIGNVDQVIKLVNSFKKTTRFFTIGLGNSVDRELVEKIAKVTGGLCKVVIDESNIDNIIIDMMTHVYKTHYGDVEVLFQNKNSENIVKYFGVMYPNNYITVFYKQDFDKPITNVTINGINCTTKEHKTWNIDLSTSQTNVNADLLRILYVNDQINNYDNNLTDIQKVDLSVKHTLMNKLTSFIIVDEFINDQSDAISIQVPQYEARFDECERTICEGTMYKAECLQQQSYSLSGGRRKLSCSISNTTKSTYNKSNNISNTFDSIKKSTNDAFTNIKNKLFNNTLSVNSSDETDVTESINSQKNANQIDTIESFIKKQKTDGHFELTDENKNELKNLFDLTNLTEFSSTSGLSELITFNMLAMVYLENENKQSYVLIIRKLKVWIKTNANLSDSEIDKYLDTMNISFNNKKISSTPL